MTTEFSNLLGACKEKLDPGLLALLQELAAGNADRDLAAKTITAAFSGQLTGNVIGTHTGSTVTSTLYLDSAEMTGSGDVPAATVIKLNKAGGSIAASLVPTAGRFLIITQTDAGTAGHTVTLAGATWNGSNTIATFDAAGDTLVGVMISATRFLVLVNIGSISFSGP